MIFLKYNFHLKWNIQWQYQQSEAKRWLLEILRFEPLYPFSCSFSMDNRALIKVGSPTNFSMTMLIYSTRRSTNWWTRWNWYGENIFSLICLFIYWQKIINRPLSENKRRVYWNSVGGCYKHILDFLIRTFTNTLPSYNE